MARSFNGTSDQISISGLISPVTQVSMSVWVNPSGFPHAYNSVIGPNSASSGFFQIHVKSTGQLAWYVRATITVDIDPGSHTLSTGTWYNLILTYDSVAGLVGYVNGVSDGTAAQSGNLIGISGQTTGIGWDPNFPSRNFDGLIAEGAIWNIILTAGEISALANGARPKDIRPSQCLGYWPLDGLQSPEPDLSGHANNGTLTGTALAAGPPVMQFTPRWPQGVIFSNTSFSPAWARGRNQFIEGFAS